MMIRYVQCVATHTHTVLGITDRNDKSRYTIDGGYHCIHFINRCGKGEMMGYRLIKGKFQLFYKNDQGHHRGSRPDGDSVWFKPDNPAHLLGIGDPPRDTEFNKGDFAQLRFEGIDALELHYNGSNHQHKGGCVSARDVLLGLLGFSNLEYAPNPEISTYVRDTDPDSKEGYILTRGVDPFGRPVAFVFPGDTTETDGGDVWLDVQMLNRSVNAKLMAKGEVYPGYYTGLPSDLRRRLTQLAVAARAQDDGIWDVDATMEEICIGSISDLEALAIWPKLYRRLFKFFKSGGGPISNFGSWLKADPPSRDDQVWIISEAHLGNIHDLIEGKNQSLRMKYQPEDIIIVPR